MGNVNADVKKKWVAALRSGRFKQGRGQLRKSEHNSNSYCCLGVLCHLYATQKAKKSADKLFVDLGTNFKGCASDNAREANTYMSRDVQRWAGIKFGEEADLVRMNDSQQQSFAEIAQHIEENL